MFSRAFRLSYFLSIGFVLAFAGAETPTKLWRPVGLGGLHLKEKQGLNLPLVGYQDNPPEVEKGHVSSLAVFQGSLYAAGLFDTAGKKQVRNIARWDGTNWYPVGTGIAGSLGSLVVFQNELYVSGSFDQVAGKKTRGFARWNGKTWSVPKGEFDGNVGAMVVVKDELVIAGEFEHIGNLKARHIAKWNGKTWSSLGEGLSNDVYALCLFKGELYAGGTFLDPAKDLDNLFRWNGKTWKGAGSFNGAVTGLVADEKRLFAHGMFTRSRKIETGAVAVTDGKTWTSVGGGLVWPQGWSREHVATLFLNDGVLYAGGRFSKMNESDKGGAALWRGANWAPVADGLSGSVNAFAVFQGELYAGGNFYIHGSDPDVSFSLGNVARL